jgi:ribosomal protein L40E
MTCLLTLLTTLSANKERPAIGFFLVFVLINVYLAKREGYPVWAGVVSGFALLLGTILLLILPSKKKHGSTAQNENHATKQCLHCGKEVLTDAKKCKHCGEWIDDQHHDSNNLTKCPYCTEEIEKGLEICPVCKEPLVKTE